ELSSMEKVSKNPLFQIDILIAMAKLYFSSSQMPMVISTISRAEKIVFQESGKKNQNLDLKMADLILLRGGYYWHRGELENALFYFKFNLEIQKKAGQTLDIAHALNNVGVLYNAIGDLQKALLFLKKAYKKYEDVNSTRGLSKTGLNIGAILIQLGELDESLKFMEKSLSNDLEDNYQEGIRVACQNIGEVYWHKRKFAQAIKILERGLAISEKMNNDFEMVEICIPLLAVYLELNQPHNAFRCIAQIIQLQKKSDNKIIQQRCWLAKGLYFKYLNSQQSLLKAQNYFQLIQDDKVRYFDITAMALVSSTEISLKKLEFTLDQFKTSNNLRFQPENLKKNFDKLIELTMQNHSYSMLIEALIIKAKWIILMTGGNPSELRLKQSQKLLEQSVKIAKKHKITRMENKAQMELKSFLDKSEYWETLSDKMSTEFLKSHVISIQNQISMIFSPLCITNLCHP
ncbi:MAG: tetratricopeptide repeat protein, partial [Promethearchaeota archaeon]